MKGMVKVSAVGAAITTIPFSYQLFSTDKSAEKPAENYESNSFGVNYDFFSNLAMSSALSGILLNNMEIAYLVMLTIIAYIIFLTIGLPLMESFLFLPQEALIT